MKTKSGEEQKPEMDVLEGQPCPMCKTNSLVLSEREDEIPYFGEIYMFSMTCSNCKFHKSDVESIEEKEPCRYSIEVGSEEDMKIRVVRSSQATVKIPHVVTIEPGTAANGYVTNVEGIINRVKNQLEQAKNDEEDQEASDKARKLLKKLNRVAWGSEKIKLIIEDPSGNSAIISDKTVVEKLKVRK